MFLKLVVFLFPWGIRRILLNKLFGYQLHPDARMGFSWIFPKKLIMAKGATIDHFSVAVNLDRIEMGANSSIGRSNWITGFPTNTLSPHFKHQSDRKAELILGASSAITKNHHLDCTNSITIGCFTTIAGYNSQFLTHSVDVYANRQDSLPILIGDYSFIGTNVVILGGTKLPAYSILGAKSLLNKSFEKEWMIYGGLPAKELQEIPKDAKYFTRVEGFVY